MSGLGNWHDKIDWSKEKIRTKPAKNEGKKDEND